MTTVTISGSGAHSSAAATDRIPASKAGVKGYLTASQIADYIESRTTLAELIRDTMGVALTQGTGITLTVSDVGDTITVAADGTAVSALTAASALGGTELYHGVQGGNDRKVTTDQIKTYTLAGTANRLWGTDGSGVGSVITLGTGLSLSGAALSLSFGANVATFLQTPSSANLAAAITDETGTGALVFGTSPTISTKLTVTGATETTSNPVISATQTWNAAGVTFTGVLLNVTSTASAAGSLLIDLQVGSSSKFSVNKSGQLTITNDSADSAGLLVSTNSGFPKLTFGLSNGVAITNQTYALTLGSTTELAWSDNAAVNSFPSSTVNLRLLRDAAAVLAQRNGTNAQTSRLYRTWTDASNYERLALQTGADYVELAAETAGTGTDNIDVRLTPAGTGNVNFPGGTLLKTRAALTNGAAANTATLLNAPAAGDPTKWIPINDNGTTRYIPAW